jgi:hypothetical protein
MRTGPTFPEVEPAKMALVGSYGSGATINSDGMFAVGRDQRQDPVRKMRGSIAGATQSAAKLASR